MPSLDSWPILLGLARLLRGQHIVIPLCNPMHIDDIEAEGTKPMKKSVQGCLIGESAAQDRPQLLFRDLDITEFEQHRM
jgi:hypothetical protein